MKLKKVDVLIIIEHKVRELESACLLKYEFEKKGYSVVIDGIYPNKESLPFKYSAKYIIIPWAYSNKDMKFYKCFLKNSPNAIFINLHHEQYSGQDDKNICLPVDEATQIYHISWGKKFTEGLLSNHCLPNTIFTVGNIKLDPFKEKLNKLFYSKKELSNKYNIDARKKWVLFVANGYHLMSNKKIEDISKLDNKISIKKDASIYNRLKYLEYVDKYLSKNSDLIFIYRPHPVYSDLDFNEIEITKLRNKYPKNFYVISDLAIGNWIVNSEKCISFHSTSGIECCSANVPYYLFRVKPLPSDLDYPFFNKYKYIIDSYDSFINAITCSNYDNSILKKAINDYFIMDNEFTFKKIVECTIKCKPILLCKNSFKDTFKNYLRYKVKNILIFLSKSKVIKKMLLNINDNRLYKIVDKTDDFFEESEINDIINKVKKVLE